MHAGVLHHLSYALYSSNVGIHDMDPDVASTHVLDYTSGFGERRLHVSDQ